MAFVCGSLKFPINSKYRLCGYKDALNEAGIAYDESLIFETEYSYSAGEALFSKIKATGATAAVVSDDELAVGVLNGAVDAGVQIPAEFEVVTSNNTKLTKMVRPKMTSISQPLYDMGAVAMRLLTKMMNKEDVKDKTILLPYSIVARESTK